MQSYLHWYDDDGGILTTGLFRSSLYIFWFVVKLFVNNQGTFRGFLTGHVVRSGLVGLVFRWSLMLSSDSRLALSQGQLVNLIAVDAQRLETTFNEMDTIVSAPLSLVIAAVLLTKFLGPTSLVGLLVLLVMSPISFIISKKAQKIKAAYLKEADLRVKKTTEAIHGIKVFLFDFAFFFLFLSLSLSLCLFF
jgi:ABC-type multidrug transport system fused ATPase/permease subunit